MPITVAGWRVPEVVGDRRPYVIHYSWNTPPRTDYNAGCLVVVSILAARKFATQIQQIRAQDAEVIEYTLPCHDYAETSTEVPEETLFYTGAIGTTYRRADIPAAWYFDPANPDRVTVPNYDGRVMDLRANSAWLNHLLADYYPSRLADPAWQMDGFLLDVVGDGYMGWLTGATAGEVAEIQAGLRWFVTQLRSAVGDNCILINNNTWVTDNADSDGIMIENHGTVEIGNEFWRTSLAKITRTGHRRNVTTNHTAAEAELWLAVPGVDQAGYSDAGDYTIGPPMRGTGWLESAGHIHLWDSTQEA